MSATFKNAKKKLQQSELRKFMKEHKGVKEKEVKKIDSPLAKYNEQGQLTCVLCKSVVRSESVWVVHINAKQHKQNVELAKKLKEKTNNFTQPLKRALSPPREVPEKKLKGILKNSNESSKSIPDDFFEKNIEKKTEQPIKTVPVQQKNEVEPMESDEALPEGFFDDPKLDAKARHQEYKDPVEEEWEKFLKVIKEADDESANIIAEDQEEATNERQIDEIEEQMGKLSKVLDLERKKGELISISSKVNQVEDEDMEAEVDDDDFDEFLDWRAKKSFT